MQIHEPRRLRLDALKVAPDNPKKPMGGAQKRGLRALLDRHGFAGVLNVASNGDGTYEVLDGASRVSELDRAGAEEVWCVVHDGLGADERRQFRLGFDRHRKKFDEARVLEQLEAMAQAGADLKGLAVLAGKENLERLLAQQAVETGGKAAAPAPVPQTSLVLYGPAEVLADIKGLLKEMRAGLSTLERARLALVQGKKFLNWEDERTLTALLAVVAALGKET